MFSAPLRFFTFILLSFFTFNFLTPGEGWSSVPKEEKIKKTIDPHSVVITLNSDGTRTVKIMPSNDKNIKKRDREESTDLSSSEEEKTAVKKPKLIDAEDLFKKLPAQAALLKLKDTSIDSETLHDLLAKNTNNDLGKKIAFSIGKSIYNRTISQNHEEYESFIAHVIKLHTGKVKSRNYYNTDTQEHIEDIIKMTLQSPSSYRFRQQDDECGLSLVKDFGSINKQKWVGGKSLGTSSKSKDINYAIVCINIDNIQKEKTKTDWTGGELKTSYPNATS